MSDFDPQIEPAHTDTLDTPPPSFVDVEDNLPITKWRSVGRILIVKVAADDTVITTGESKFVFAWPASLDGAVVRDVQAFVSTVSSGAAPSIGIRNGSTEILTTNITIDANENTSYTAATPRVIDPVNNTFLKGNLISIDIDTAGVGATGLGVIFEVQ